MKFVLIVLGFIVPAAIVLAQSSGQGSSSVSVGRSPTAAKTESPFACNRLALAPEQRKRHFDQLGPAVRSMKKSVRELPDGYEFEFAPDAATVQLVAEWAAGEHLCCPFFKIELRMEPEQGPLWLRLTGREGTKDFIKADAASWIRPSL